MGDYNPDEVRKNIYRNMSYSQKWEEFLKLRKAAWDIKAAAVRMQHPDWTEHQVQEKVKEIFLYATT
jgi:hypothetical protein